MKTKTTKQKTFFIGKEKLVIQNESDFISILKKLVESATLKSVFVKKTGGSYGGSNTYRITEADFNGSVNFSEMFSVITRSGFLFQETINQHSEMNRLNSSCLNTIRMDSFVDKQTNVHLMSAFLRMSSVLNHVDNVSAGGCFVGVDMETGKLNKTGYTSVTIAGGKLLESHPLTNIVFETFTIPYFDEVKKLVTRAAGLVPSLRLIGWDIAITPNGPILIEGNTRYAIQVNDLTYGGYRKHPVFKQVLEEIN
ncbi:MAG: hypothetical protein HC906_04795 [Bacteroidales bacterium]|nr:hypothetical protein [Bacteroidales bacterium]